MKFPISAATLATLAALAPAQTTLNTLQSASPGDGYGSSMAAGNLDAGPSQDLVIGAPLANGGAGAVFLEYFRDVGVPYVRVVIPAPPGASRFGASVAVGDLNGDAFDDIVVGAPGNTSTDRGSWYVYFGQPFSASPPQLAYPGKFGALTDRLGKSVAITPDMNGDGLDDILVGAPGSNYVDFHEGLQGALLFVQFGILQDSFGDLVVGGDFNGDGIGDMAARYQTNVPGLGGRAAFAAYATAPGLAPGGLLSSIKTTSPTLSFFTAAAAGDTDLDGNDEIVLGDVNASPSGLTQAGRLSIWQPNTGLITDSKFGGTVADSLGFIVASAGDINGDGSPDVMGAAKVTDRIEFQAGDSPAGACIGGESLGTDRSPLSGVTMDSMVALDRNGDGFVDYAVADDNGATATVKIVSHANLQRSLSSTVSKISASGGGAPLFLRAGPAAAGNTYFLAASDALSATGFPLDDGSIVPLDVTTTLLVTSLNNPTLLFPSNLGALDANGNALSRIETCSLTFDPALMGAQIHVAYATIGSSGTGHASTVLSFELVP